MGYNLLINGVYWGEITRLLTIDPNFLGHPSGPRSIVRADSSEATGKGWVHHPVGSSSSSHHLFKDLKNGCLI